MNFLLFLRHQMKRIIHSSINQKMNLLKDFFLHLSMQIVCTGNVYFCEVKLKQ